MSDRTRQDAFSVPDGFVDAVMARVAAAPRPVPARAFAEGVRDRSSSDLIGSLVVAWRLTVGGGMVPRMVRVQAIALIVLVAASLAGTSVVAAAAAYRAVAPVIFPVTEFPAAIPEDAPDVLAPAVTAPRIAAPAMDRPDAVAARHAVRTGALDGGSPGSAGDDGSSKVGASDGRREHEPGIATDESGDRSGSDGHGDGEPASSGKDGGTGSPDGSKDGTDGGGSTGGDADQTDGSGTGGDGGSSIDGGGTGSGTDGGG